MFNAGQNSGGGGSASFVTNIKCVTKQADYAIQSTDSGVLFDNFGAGAQVNFTLPPSQARPASGLVWVFGFQVLDAQILRVLPGNGTDVIWFGNADTTPATGYIEQNAIGSLVWIENPESGLWVCYGYGQVGWTVE